MYQAIEAVCREGRIVPLEAVSFHENESLVILRLPAKQATPHASTSAALDWRGVVGVLKESPNWNEDPQRIQEGMRREWD